MISTPLHGVRDFDDGSAVMTGSHRPPTGWSEGGFARRRKRSVLRSATTSLRRSIFLFDPLGLQPDRSRRGALKDLWWDAREVAGAGGLTAGWGCSPTSSSSTIFDERAIAKGWSNAGGG